MSDRVPGLEALTRLYRILLAAYPQKARNELAQDLEAFFRRRYREAWREGGAPRAFGAAAAGLLDLVRYGVAERMKPTGATLDAVYGGGVVDMVTDLWNDSRLALRSLRRSPVFTAVAVLTLALGIGANTAVFSVLRALVLAPLPYDGLDRMVVIRRELVGRGIPYYPAAPADLVDYHAAEGFEEIVGVVSVGPTLNESDGPPERLTGAQVTPNFFHALRVTPALGHDFSREDGLPPDPAAQQDFTQPIILSHEFWTRRFGADPGIIGRVIHIGPSATVIGVLSPGFRFVTSEVSQMQTDQPDIWMPMRINPGEPFRGSFFVYTFGRLKPGVSIEQAAAQLSAVVARQRERFANYEAAGTHSRLVPFQADVSASVRPLLLALFGAVAFVMLIACVNVANLLLVRATSRVREVSIRAALGGGRGRILRQMLAEAGVLAVLGGTAGLLLAWTLMPVLARLVPPELPRVGPLRLDVWVLAFSALATILAAFVFGLYPAVRASGANVMGSLRGRGDGSSVKPVVRARLVVAEVALSFVLVVGAGLMVRSFVEIRGADPGFDAEGVLTFRAAWPPGAFSADERVQIRARLRERMAAIPGVVSVGTSSDAPLSAGVGAVPYGNEAAVADGDESDFRQAFYRTAAPGYFETVGTPLVEGRTFSDADQADSTGYVVVDQRLANVNWPGESAIGKRIYAKTVAIPSWFEVIGVVRNQLQASLAGEDQETIWFSDRDLGAFRATVWSVRGRGDPSALLAPVKAAVSEVDGRFFLENVHPLAYYVAQAQAPTALILQIAGGFAILALLLAVVGLYGVIAYQVRERAPEFGLRMALGSGRDGIFRLVLRQGMTLALVGVVVGVVGSLLLTRVMTRVLVGVSPTDPITLAAVALLFVIAAAAASVVPAHRAVRVDPMATLRGD